MNRIILGLSILLSVVLLSGCGSGSKGGAGSDGTSGSAGATGATGATGAAGSISVPDADSNLAITVTKKDTDSTALENDIHFVITGFDNESIDSRKRYYAYEATSATAKYGVWDPVAAGNSATSEARNAFKHGSDLYNIFGRKVWNSDHRHFDTRGLPQDIVYFDSNGGAASQLSADGYGAPITSYFMICPGNEAGDATTCASVAIRDRVAHGVAALAGAGGTDTGVSIAYGNSAFQVVADNISAGAGSFNTLWTVVGGVGTGAQIFQNRDNASIAFTIGDDTKANAYAAEAQNSDNTSAVVKHRYSRFSNVAFKGNDAYIASAGDDNSSGSIDNMTFWKRTSGLGDFAIDNSTLFDNITTSIVQLGSDGTDVFLVRDNLSGGSYSLVGTVLQDVGSVITDVDNNIQSISTLDMCSTTTSDKMIIVVDNGTVGHTPAANAGVYGDFTADAGFDVFTLHDNGTLAATATDVAPSGGLYSILSCSLSVSSDGSTYIMTILEDSVADGDNITVLSASSSDLSAWGKVYEDNTQQASTVKVSHANSASGTSDMWIALDDGTNVDLYHSDNGTSGGLVLVHTISSTSLGGIAHNGGSSGSAKIAIAVDDGTDAQVDIYYE